MKTVLSYRDGEAVPAPSASPALVLALLLCALIPAKVCAEDSSPSGFDAQTLQQRGIDPQLASLLLSAPRYAAGQHTVNLRVNGQRRGRLAVNFDQQGKLCFDRALLDDAHALAAHVRGGQAADPPGTLLQLDLTPREVGLLRFDQCETVWFAVYATDGSFIADD